MGGGASGFHWIHLDILHPVRLSEEMPICSVDLMGKAGQACREAHGKSGSSIGSHILCLRGLRHRLGKSFARVCSHLELRNIYLSNNPIISQEMEALSEGASVCVYVCVWSSQGLID